MLPLTIFIYAAILTWVCLGVYRLWFNARLRDKRDIEKLEALRNQVHDMLQRAYDQKMLLKPEDTQWIEEQLKLIEGDKECDTTSGE